MRILSLFLFVSMLFGQGAPTDSWPTYNGDYSGRRYSPLAEINASNIGGLALAWFCRIANVGAQRGVGNPKITATPLMVNGILYFTIPDHVWAIDARTGRQIWHYQRQLPQGLKVCCGMVNRGFAILGDRLFMATLDAHFVALEMKTGKVIYDVEMATVQRVGLRDVVVACVVFVVPPSEEIVSGSAVVRVSNEQEAVARAVLDATNRRLMQLAS